MLNYGDFLLTKFGCFRLTLFGDFLLTLTVFNDVMKAYLLYGEMPERSHIINLMKNDSLYNVNSDSTYSRRASTVSGWLNWIVSLCELE